MSKKTYILCGVFIFLLLGAFFYDPILRWKDSLGKPKNFLQNISNFDDIDKMEVKRNGVNIVLEKKDGKWKVAHTKDFYLTDDLLGSIKDSLNKAKEQELELVSSNKDKKGEFKTDEKNGVEVKMYQGDKLICDFVVGKIGPHYTDSYISKPNINETYLVATNLNSAFDHDNWLDKTIFKSDGRKISKIRFQYPNREFIVERKVATSSEEKNGDWSGTKPYKFKVDQGKMDKILNIMSSLRAIKVPEQKFEGTDLEKHLIIVEASGDGVDNILMVGGAKEEDGKKYFYAKRGDSDNIYLITESQKDLLDQTIKSLR